VTVVNESNVKSGPAKTAIVWNYHLDGQGGGQQQTQHPTIHEDKPGFDWLHLRSDDPGAVEYMRELGLDPKMIEALSAIETRPRMQLLEDGVLINLRGVWSRSASGLTAKSLFRHASTSAGYCRSKMCARA
jgi:Mg2+ and Co2+ transporter CorA